MVSSDSPDVSQEKRAPVSVSLVLDKSGSMGGSKLDLVKKSAKFLVKQLGVRDYVSIVAYDSMVTTPCKLTQATEPAKESAGRALTAVCAGSCTNLSGGLFTGLEDQLNARPVAVAAPAPRAHATCAAASAAGGEDGFLLVDAEERALANSADQDGNASADATQTESETATPPGFPLRPVKSVFLFTDGLANVGLTDTGAIVATMHGMVSTAGSAVTGGVPNPIKVATFGFGADHDPEMLQAIADAGSGTYYFIDSPESIPAAFADALGGLLTVFAQNITVRVVATGGARLACVRSGFPQRRDGDAIIVSVPDLYAEEVKDLVVELELPAATSAQGSTVLSSGASEESGPEVARATVTYVDVVSGAGIVTVECALRLTRGGSPGGAPDERVAVARARLDTAERMAAAVVLAEGGKRAEAEATLHAHREVLRGLAPVSKCGAAQVTALTADMDNLMIGFSSEQSYAQWGKKLAFSAAASHNKQRSTVVAAAPRSVPSEEQRSTVVAAAPRSVPSEELPGYGGVRGRVRSLSVLGGISQRAMPFWRSGKKFADAPHFGETQNPRPRCAAMRAAPEVRGVARSAAVQDEDLSMATALTEANEDGLRGHLASQTEAAPAPRRHVSVYSNSTQQHFIQQSSGPNLG